MFDTLVAHVIEINDAAALEDLRLGWNALLLNTREATFFQSLDWLQAYWSHFGGDQKLRLLIVSSHGQLTGILPLVVRRVATRFGVLRKLTYPLDDWGVAYGPIGPSPTATLIAALRHIRRTPRDWDLVELGWIDLKHVDAGRTIRSMLVQLGPSAQQPYATTAQVETAAGWTNYWNSRSTRLRKNVRYAERKLAEIGALEHVNYRPGGAACGEGDPRWDLYDECERLAALSWQGDSTTGNTLSHERVRLFLRSAHKRAAKAGAVDLNLLKCGDRAVAFNYNYHYQGLLFGLRMGFDAAAAKAGAGVLLQAKTLELAFARGDRLVDLGADYLDVKRYWHTRLTQTYRARHYAESPRGQLFRAKHWLSGRWAVRASASKAASDLSSVE